MRYFVYIILISLTFTFCSESINQHENDTFELSDTLTINYQQTLYNNKEDLSIRFDSLVSDGRCPIDLRCFWEGDAEIKLKLTKNDQSVYFSLHTARDYFTRDTVLLGYEIKFIDLKPYPKSDIQYAPEYYTAVLLIN